MAHGMVILTHEIRYNFCRGFDFGNQARNLANLEFAIDQIPFEHAAFGAGAPQ